jgi:hypothetical protein
LAGAFAQLLRSRNIHVGWPVSDRTTRGKQRSSLATELGLDVVAARNDKLAQLAAA